MTEQCSLAVSLFKNNIYTHVHGCPMGVVVGVMVVLRSRDLVGRTIDNIPPVCNMDNRRPNEAKVPKG